MEHTRTKLENLRKQFPRFVYEKFDWKMSENDLKIVFYFSTGLLSFQPKITIKEIGKKEIKRVGKEVLENLVFNIGLIEMISYWKATCSPMIEIKAGCLDKNQIKWWKNLIIKGMGQYFYENKIDWRGKNFLTLKISCQRKTAIAGFYIQSLKNRYLVPFAGGRDSIVTLENLKKKYGKEKIALFTLNPIGKIKKTAKVTGIKKQVTVFREMDENLFVLNKKGYLNGHTPFTSLLSFVSVLCAVIFNYRHIAFSNEKSANVGNVKYLGKIINHQWAKSSEFEKMFKYYSGKYLAKNADYFSHIRKFGELEISKILSKYPQYFPVFSSCNAGMRISAKGTLLSKERWCGECVKCLFVYLSLYPYLGQNDLNKIFGKNVFANKKLLPLLKQLIGEQGIKPFECVGTRQESRLALELSKKKAKTEQKVPFLLR